METMPKSQPEAPKSQSPEVPHIDFNPERFSTELDYIAEVAWSNANQLPEQEQLPKYFKNLNTLRTKYLEISVKQHESEDHVASTRALLGAFILSQHALYGRLEGRGASGHKIAIEENIRIQSSIAEYLGELNEKYTNNPAEATKRASQFWASQERCLKIYFERNPHITFDAWKNGILRDSALQWIIAHKCNWDIIPQENIHADADQKVDLVALSSRDVAYLFQIKPTDQKEDRGFVMDQTFPPTGDSAGYTNEVTLGMRSFAVENGLEDNTTRGFLIRVSASGEHINKQTGMPSPQFAQSIASELMSIDSGASHQRAA